MKVFLIVMFLLCTGLSLMARADIAITFGAPGGGGGAAHAQMAQRVYDYEHARDQIL